ncbi:MAG: dTDP-4-dehydrorhamnose 3,5-epimerase family protein, partial [Deltaproteobacteria bacterium]|nr:dTDP-4-dehydrorhamnose 3,5-epimerase family protein [Deltaproteobacteria bacterium]
AEAANQIYIPAGAAHGFYTLSQEATLVYNVTTVYAPQHDAGLLWSSAGIDWPDQAPLISERDAALPPLSEFVSPFVYKSS